MSKNEFSKCDFTFFIFSQKPETPQEDPNRPNISEPFDFRAELREQQEREEDGYVRFSKNVMFHFLIDNLILI